MAKYLKKDLRTYQLVHFVKEDATDGTRCIDCIPNHWISYDENIGSCMAKFCPPPYTKDIQALLYCLIKKNDQPPADWPLFEVSLLGHAETYKEALKKLRSLENAQYVYTTDNEENAKKKSEAFTETYKNRNIDELLSEKNLSNSSGSENNEEFESGTSTSEENFNEKKKKFNKKKLNIKNIEIKKPAAKSFVAAIERPEKELNRKGSHDKGRQNVFLKTDWQSRIAQGHTGSNNNITPAVKHCSATVHGQDSNANDNGINSSKGSTKNGRQQIASTNARDIAGDDNLFLSPDTMMIYGAVNKLTTKVGNLEEEMQELRRSLERSMNTKLNKITTSTFFDKFNFTKILSTDEFRAFERRLKDDKEFHQDFMACLESLVDSEMKKTINGILKKIFTREFAMSCTVMRESRKKNDTIMLKGTRFYEDLFELVRSFHDVTEKKYHQALSACLANSKDWDGQRNLRRPGTNVVQ